MKKKGNKKMPTPRHKLIHNPIPTSLFLSSPQCISCSQFNVKMFFLCLMHSQQTNKIQNKDVGMGLWMSLCLGVGIFLFPFFFMHWHPYIPLHFIKIIFPLVYILLIRLHVHAITTKHSRNFYEARGEYIINCLTGICFYLLCLMKWISH